MRSVRFYPVKLMYCKYLFSKNHILFEFDQTIVVSRLIDGDISVLIRCFPAITKPKLKLIKRISGLYLESHSVGKRGRKETDHYEITDNSMELRIDSAMGSMNENNDIDKEGKDILIGFNPRFLIDALKVIDDETISIYS